MDQVQIEIITGNDGNSAEVEEPAGAAGGEAFNAREGSKEADSGSQPQNLNYKSHAQKLQAGQPMIFNEKDKRILDLVKARGLEPTESNLWKVAFEDSTNRYTKLEKRFYKREEEIRSVKNEIYQVVGFFSAFQGLLITAAAQSILLHCNNVGFMLALSAFATAVAVFGIWQKITAMQGLRLANNSIELNIKELSFNLSDLRSGAFIYPFDNLHHWPTPIRDPLASREEFLVSYRTWLLVCVIAFGGLCMVAMRQIVCNPGHSLPSN